MRIRIGNQTAFSASRILEPFQYAVANRFGAFEWFPDKKENGAGWAEDDISDETRLQIRDTARKNDISMSVHAPWRNSPLKQEQGDDVTASLDFARDIGASLYNVHLENDQGIASFVEAILPLLRHLADFGMKLSIENTPLTGPGDFNDLFSRLREIAPSFMSSVGVCLDVGHANLCSATRNDYLRFVDMLGPHVPIIHVHMHENYGDADTHLPLFTGPSGRDPAGIKGLLRRLKDRGFSGSIILEQWPVPVTLLNEARDRLIEIISQLFVPEGTVPEHGSEHDIVRMITEANQRLRSWRRRLEWVHGIITDGAFDDLGSLVYIAIYLRFIGTGEVPCSEDGGHYRPSHHARISHGIFEHLSKITSGEKALVIRKIYPWLPSFEDTFLREEPLTRIRDIAHRNDIPGELKEEIKRTLQNKLHRSAGPEDLATSAALLERITASDARLSPSFVEEFRIFHEELRKFFNAESLEERLRSLAVRKIGPVPLIRDFLEKKGRADTPGELVQCLELLVALRSRLGQLSGETKGQERQRIQMADIGLEEYSFVILSRLMNYFDAEQGRPPWPTAVVCIMLGIRNLRLSGFDSGECLAIESELDAWSGGFDPKDRRHLLRLKATVDRCRRLAETYCDMILSLFPERAERLGRALGAPDHAIRVFSEADIRSHPVFQVSKLVSFVGRNIRSGADLPLWDVVVPGRVTGLLVEAVSLDSLPAGQDIPVAALIDRIEGDEYIPARVVAIIARHDIPHLSHIAVRARQARVVFVVCEDPVLVRGIRALTGQNVQIDAPTEGAVTEISPVPADREAAAGPKGTYQTLPGISEVDLSSGDHLLPLTRVTLMNGGGKADGARRLAGISTSGNAGFSVPAGMVVPFGVMAHALRAEPDLAKEYGLLSGSIDSLLPAEAEAALKRLRQITDRLKVPDSIVRAAAASFGSDSMLMVRSSANCEDLEGMSGAGLYDSVVNVSPADLAAAVRRVWSSLWNRRAAEGRKIAGLPHHAAYMAVLIQEMIVPEFSFIIHTVNPAGRDRDELYLEVAAGLGEILASAHIPGAPYRMVINKKTEKVQLISFASFSRAARPGGAGGSVLETVDYSRIRLSTVMGAAETLGVHIARIGRAVEESLGMPQDIEGLLADDTVYLVQSRPQQVVIY